RGWVASAKRRSARISDARLFRLAFRRGAAPAVLAAPAADEAASASNSRRLIIGFPPRCKCSANLGKVGRPIDGRPVGVDQPRPLLAVLGPQLIATVLQPLEHGRDSRMVDRLVAVVMGEVLLTDVGDVRALRILGEEVI